jgi:cyclohexyl-isocyanide hydratase
VPTMAEDHIHIGAIVFPGMDPIDFTGPFEVLSRVPGSTFHVLWKETIPIRDVKGLIITPRGLLTRPPQLNLLVVPGGFGQEALMDDDVVLKLIQVQAEGTKYVFSVCTGALVCGQQAC